MLAKSTLIDTLLRHAPESGIFSDKIGGFAIVRRDTPNTVERCMVNPIILISVQGKKRSVIGSVAYEYEAGQSLILGVELPTDSIVLDASPEKPYCSMVLALDVSLITEILTKLPKKENKSDIDGQKQNISAVACFKTDPDVLKAFTSLAELLDTPKHIEYLAPLIIKEIHYRLLLSPLGKHIKAIYFLGTQSNEIARAVTWLEKNYKAPLKVEALAKYANMSVSAFHRNFKAITTLSPLQYQKKLRLFEAQRLMLEKRMNATTASYAVGYESSTQFIREYKRMFGNSPKRDITNIVTHTS